VERHRTGDERGRQSTWRWRTRRGLVQAGIGGIALFVGEFKIMGSVARAQESTPAASPCPPTTPEEAKAVAEAYFAAFNDGDVAALDALLAPDYRHHGAAVTEQDRDLHEQRLLTYKAAFPDQHYELEDMIADGDLVAARWVFTGTLQGPFAGVQPAGQHVAVRGVHIHRVECGKIAETWNSGDAIGLLRQIGALPPGPAARTPLQEETTPTAGSPAATACPPATSEESAEIGRRWTEDALDKHNLDLLDEIVSPTVVHHAGAFVDEIGRDALKSDLAALLAGFPDFRFTADLIVAEDDRAAVRWSGRGTQTAPFLGIAPTGRAVVFTGINYYRVACGLIVEGWSEADTLSLLQQLGVVPQDLGLTATPTS
jgi:steroid delta-isomerase-like uncharacterized protein